MEDLKDRGMERVLVCMERDKETGKQRGAWKREMWEIWKRKYMK